MHTRAPLWKNLLLIALVMVGFIYALPNLYSEQPVVQVTLESIQHQADVRQQVNATLAKMSVKPISVDESVPGTWVFHFSHTDDQLKAFEAIKDVLGQRATVALNLMPSTPAWMKALGAEPMKQGLDLRGGVHFLLEVDVEGVMQRHVDGVLKSLSQGLREEKIRYIGLRRLMPYGLEIKFKDESAQKAADQYIKMHQSELVPQIHTDRLSLAYELSPVAMAETKQATMEQTMSILRNRVNELGVGEAIVQQQGVNRVAVDLPGIQDAARAKQILGGTATLEFRLVDETHDAQQAQASGIVPFQSKLYLMNGQPILLQRQVVLSGESITSASSSFDQQSATPAVQIQLGGGGEQYFSKVTRDHVGNRLAIVFVENKTILQKVNGQMERTSQREERVISAPVIQSALGSQFQITGLSDPKEALNLALLLRAGALPASIYPIEELTVGPSLGQENIQRGLISLEVGMLLILIVMVVYYRGFGMVANVALFLNLVFLSALMSMIGATLTLPGIAGFVLTVGMAVDANVLINERIREELRSGLSPHAAIHAGYERAFATILDSNVTTFIVGVVLIAIGTGPVKGFAIILCLGILTSMLTSITYTRMMIDWIYGGRTVKQLSIGIHASTDSK